jgi:transcriptional regulator with XRE-family HTH domain
MYGGFSGVHAVYMARKTRETGKARKKQKPQAVVWLRPTIRKWRKYRKLTLPGMAERMGRLNPPVKTTHASLSRYERGLQKPPGHILEVMAAVLDTDVDSMLNHEPPGPLDHEFRQILRRATSDQREWLLEIARKVVKPENP